MKHVSMVEFRRNSKGVLARIQKGERFILTHRGKPIAQLEPMKAAQPDSDAPFYSLTDLAESGDSLTNAEMDAIVYDSNA